MKKTLLTGVLITTLLIGLFTLTGCGNNNKNESKPEENKNTNVQVEATEFYIQNMVPSTTIKEIYATVTNLNTWTPNLINGLELATGTRAKIGLGLTSSTSSWDIKVVDEEGTAVTFTADLTKILQNKGGSVTLQINENNELAAVVE